MAEAIAALKAPIVPLPPKPKNYRILATVSRPRSNRVPGARKQAFDAFY
jgi:hypothetical protein